MLRLLVSLILIFSQSAFAKEDVLDKAALKEAVVQFQIQKASTMTSLLFPMQKTASLDECNPSNTSCIDAMCNRMPSYHCDDQSEIRRVAAACTGNWGGECVTAICGRMPSYHCDDISELERVGAACRSVSHLCVTSICERMPSYHCDDISEMERVGRACGGLYDGDCIKAVCNRMPSYNCDDISELEQVAATCRGE